MSTVNIRWYADNTQVDQGGVRAKQIYQFVKQQLPLEHFENKIEINLTTPGSSYLNDIDVHRDNVRLLALRWARTGIFARKD